MANFREIVTKAVIGKTKKSTKDNLEIVLDNEVDNVLGCWVINNNFRGKLSNKKVNIDGSFDINVWYSYNNNTKTNVVVKNFTYNDEVNVKLKDEETLTNDKEIIVRSLTNPQVSEVNSKGNVITLTLTKELGIEVVGNVKMSIDTLDEIDDYEEDIDSSTIDNEINENYLNDVNQK